VGLPPGAQLMLEPTARQIAQYHPAWRIDRHKVNPSRDARVAFFSAQGLRYDEHAAKLTFNQPEGDVVDGMWRSDQQPSRVWRKPR
jgi:hypothetical protein